jgi:hypothetical protein
LVFCCQYLEFYHSRLSKQSVQEFFYGLYLITSSA